MEFKESIVEKPLWTEIARNLRADIPEAIERSRVTLEKETVEAALSVLDDRHSERHVPVRGGGIDGRHLVQGFALPERLPRHVDVVAAGVSEVRSQPLGLME